MATGRDAAARRGCPAEGATDGRGDQEVVRGKRTPLPQLEAGWPRQGQAAKRILVRARKAVVLSTFSFMMNLYER